MLAYDVDIACQKLSIHDENDFVRDPTKVNKRQEGEKKYKI